jgi:hypothetical protein
MSSSMVLLNIFLIIVSNASSRCGEDVLLLNLLDLFRFGGFATTWHEPPSKCETVGVESYDVDVLLPNEFVSCACSCRVPHEFADWVRVVCLFMSCAAWVPKWVRVVFMFMSCAEWVCRVTIHVMCLFGLLSFWILQLFENFVWSGGGYGTG